MDVVEEEKLTFSVYWVPPNIGKISVSISSSSCKIVGGGFSLCKPIMKRLEDFLNR